MAALSLPVNLDLADCIAKAITQCFVLCVSMNFGASKLHSGGSRKGVTRLTNHPTSKTSQAIPACASQTHGQSCRHMCDVAGEGHVSQPTGKGTTSRLAHAQHDTAQEDGARLVWNGVDRVERGLEAEMCGI